MNRRSFLRVATGYAVAAPVAIRTAVAMAPKKYAMTQGVWVANENLCDFGFPSEYRTIDFNYTTKMWLVVKNQPKQNFMELFR